MDTLQEKKHWQGGYQFRRQYGEAVVNVVRNLDYLQRAACGFETQPELALHLASKVDHWDVESRRNLYLTAAENCQSGSEIVALSNSAKKLYKDHKLAHMLLIVAARGCRTTKDFAMLAQTVTAAGGDRDQVHALLEMGRRVCVTLDDYKALILAVRTLLGDHATSLTLVLETATTLKSPGDLIRMGELCCRELGEEAIARQLYRTAARQASIAVEFVEVSQMIMATLNDRAFCLELYRQIGKRLHGHGELMPLARGVLEHTGEMGLADSFFQRSGNEAESAEQLIETAIALAEQVGNLDAALACLHKAESVAVDMGSFKAVAKAILSIAPDPLWRDSIILQLEKRVAFQREYGLFMEKERKCTACACFRSLAREVCSLTSDSAYCRRLYMKAQQCSTSFAELLSVAEGVALHVGDAQWLQDICEQLLDSRNDLVSTNAVVQLMIPHLPEGRRWAKERYRLLERECFSSGCFVRLAVSVLALLDDSNYCRALFDAADQAAVTQTELIFLARFVEEKLDDRLWVEDLYLRVMNICQTGLEFAGLIRAVSGSRYGSLECLRSLHELAEKSFQKPHDVLLLAESVARHCQDPAWSRRLYECVIKEMGEGEKRFVVAESILCALGDCQFAQSVRTLT